MLSVTVQTAISSRNELVEIERSCPEIPYLELAIPLNAGKIKSVTFTTISRDQGWASEKGYSYSWFDAVVRRPGNQTDLPTLRICSNRTANPQLFKQKTRWDLESNTRNHYWIESLRPGDIVGVLPRAVYPQRVNIIREASIELEYEDNGKTEGSLELSMQKRTGFQPAVVECANDRIYQRSLDLNRLEIRLLVVQPGGFDDPIKCSFDYICLNRDEPPLLPFDCLSYCWSTSNSTANIFLDPDYDGSLSWDGREIPVGNNVETAMRRIRNADQPLRIWIDNVCINQEDLEERSGQVRIMSLIYSKASTVHIWLGEGDLLFDAAGSAVHDLYNYMYGDCPGGDRCQCISVGISMHSVDFRDPETKRLQRAEGKGKNANRFVQAQVDTFWEARKASFSEKLNKICDGWYNGELVAMMSVLYRHPWFTRVWVLQEAIFAPEAFIRWNTHAIQWFEIIAVSDLLCQHRIIAPHLKWGGSLALVWSQLSGSLKSRNAPNEIFRGSELPSSLPISQSNSVLDIYLSALSMKATDPRDKLFALLSFFPFANNPIDTATQPREFRSLIEPNYTKDLATVLADFTRWWILTHQSLAILSYIHANPARAWRRMVRDSPSIEGPRLPTWVIGTEGRNWWARATLESQFSFRATGNLKPSIYLDSNEYSSIPNDTESLKLGIKGTYVASISRISHYPIDFLTVFSGEGAGTDKGGDTIGSVFDRIFDPYGWTSFWSLQENPAEPPKHTDIAGLRSWYLSHLKTHWAYRDRDELMAIALPSDASEGEKEWKLQGTKQLPTCIDPCFFVSDNGYHGLCPWTAREGDFMVLLDGGNVPYILRPILRETLENGEENQIAGEFEFVGECFIDGIMDETWVDD
ncbi:heterokaryon incompatibility protein-domain-containing protein [Xylaria arbuscula]|nr:heterokaryon incompatibility protein-domain-containing protein [Xylaria arbuscula]